MTRMLAGPARMRDLNGSLHRSSRRDPSHLGMDPSRFGRDDCACYILLLIYYHYRCRYLQDPGSFFVISSDFCHWGDRFRLSPRHNTLLQLHNNNNNNNDSATG